MKLRKMVALMAAALVAISMVDVLLVHPPRNDSGKQGGGEQNGYRQGREGEVRV